MLKIQLLTVLGCAFALSAFGQYDQHQLPANKTVLDASTVKHITPLSVPASEDAVIWYEDFANGIPASWNNEGYNDLMQPVPACQWEYRGPSTSPDNSVGSRGAFASPNDPILSATASNGFVIFDSDYLDNDGIPTNIGGGSAPVPHMGTLTTESIDLSGKTEIMLEMSCYARLFWADLLVVFSSDGGATWSDSVVLYSQYTLRVNGSTSNVDQIQINVSDYIGNSANAKMRFIFDGRFGNANGNGYYFWCIDDIRISDLPDHSLKFVDNYDGAPSHDMIFNGAGVHGKYGYIPLLQSRPVSFDSNIFNFGAADQTSLHLDVEIIDQSNNTIASLQSQSITLNANDTADYSVMFTPSWTPSTVGTYRVIYSAVSDSVNDIVATIPRDTFTLFVTDTVMSLDYNSYSNSLTTDDLGFDASAVASRFDLTRDDVVYGVDIHITASTEPGGVFEVLIYDTTGFDFADGFPAAPLAYEQRIVSSADIMNGVVTVPVRDAFGIPAGLAIQNTGAYYVVVYLYSNAGANTIAIKNDQTIVEPVRASMVYVPSNNRWYAGFQGSLDLNAPHIRIRTCDYLRPYTCAISVSENTLESKLTLYPNPVHDVLRVDTEGLEGDCMFQLINVEGKIVQAESRTLQNGETLLWDMSDLSAGIYFLSVQLNDDIAVLRFPKQ